MKKYRIGQLAKMMCVSLDFIRFYEEKGLIQSTVDTNNHYHYYDISQSEIISKIKQYRKLGYNVTETIDLIKNADKDQILLLYASLAETQRKNLKRSAFAIQYLEFLRNALTAEDGTWYISLKPALWFLPHTRDDDFLEDPAVVSSFKAWSEQAPFTFSMDRWVIDAEGTLQAIYHGRAIEYAVAEDCGLHPTGPAEFYPQKRCIEYYLDYIHANEFNLSSYIGLDSIQAALDVVKEKRFVIDGDVFVRLVTLFKEDGRNHDRFVVYIPIK